MDSGTIKTEVIRQVKTQNAIDNAKQLIDKINEHCFQRCVPKPSASLTYGEEACFTQCTEKYIAGWNQIQATCISRLQREQ
ncbi:Tim10/DDP family zinc finger-domain-containing protein [Xylaria cf. heliscus]|nr:Tim10/DDP family zinc finger-domain-containing protein [Xylaria cf. heliscus]